MLNFSKPNFHNFLEYSQAGDKYSDMPIKNGKVLKNAYIVELQ